VRGGSACAHSGRDRRPAGQSRGGRTRTPARRTRHATQINQQCAVRERVCHHECFILSHCLDNQNHHHTESGTADSSLRASPLCMYVRKSALFLTLHLLQLRSSAAAAAVRIGARRPHLLRPRGLQPPHALLLRVHVPRGLQALGAAAAGEIDFWFEGGYRAWRSCSWAISGCPAAEVTFTAFETAYFGSSVHAHVDVGGATLSGAPLRRLPAVAAAGRAALRARLLRRPERALRRVRGALGLPVRGGARARTQRSRGRCCTC
jgi:hypothetical protein